MAEQQQQQQRRKKGRRNKEKEVEWQERVVQIRRVTKVVKGGKNLSFRAIVV
ncbi:MAG: 30S ribosomal protein S5, partial [Trichodesmium sp. St5_bin2_1]|nr:30S ribosomal protein S5 [Trichodesmium sp. St5_bin2_1]